MDLAQFEFGDFFEGGTDAGGFFGFDAGHLHQDAVVALGRDQRFGGAHGVEAFLDYEFRLVDLLDGDGHLGAVIGFFFLNAE